MVAAARCWDTLREIIQGVLLSRLSDQNLPRSSGGRRT